jgi:hypothetical protein
MRWYACFHGNTGRSFWQYRFSGTDPPALGGLARLRHYGAEEAVDAGGIAGAVLLQPFEDVGVQTHGDELFGGPAKPTELLVGERGDVGVVDSGVVAALLALSDPIEHSLLGFSEGLAEDRFGAHADQLRGPR